MGNFNYRHINLSFIMEHQRVEKWESMYAMAQIKQRLISTHGLKGPKRYNSDIFQYIKEKNNTHFTWNLKVSYNFPRH
jgi:hypothetical protein